MEKILAGATLLLITVVIASGLGLLGAIPTFLLWNWLIPSIFGLREINYWEAWGLYVLIGILVRGFSFSYTKPESS